MGKCKSVMIVEDDPYIRDSLKHLIELEGYVVFIAENGLEALKKLKILSQVSHPCLVLADFMMPMMDGVTLLKEMQHNDVLSSIPTVMVSANAPPPDVPRFIRKPFQLESILKLLKEFC